MFWAARLTWPVTALNLSNQLFNIIEWHQQKQERNLKRRVRQPLKGGSSPHNEFPAKSELDLNHKLFWMFSDFKKDMELIEKRVAGLAQWVELNYELTVPVNRLNFSQENLLENLRQPAFGIDQVEALPLRTALGDVLFAEQNQL